METVRSHPHKSLRRGCINVLVVDDHPLVRERLAEVINREGDLHVCGEAEDRSTAAQMVRDLQPHLAVVDLSLRNSHGLDLIKDIRTVSPKTLILVVSMHDETLYAERVIRAGAQGYITKQEATRKMISAIRTVLANKLYIGEAISSQIMTRLCVNSQAKTIEPADLLSDREMQVFELTGRGLITKEISERLGVGIKAVETYRARAKAKLGHHNHSEFLQAAIRHAAECPQTPHA